MIRNILFVGLILLQFSCVKNRGHELFVKNQKELEAAIQHSGPGDKIILANGTWQDVQISIVGKGSKESPVTICAETEGKVIIEGRSFIKIGGNYLIISGLHFKNGYSPEDAVIEFCINKDSVANYCRVTNCVIDRFVKPGREMQDHYIAFWGQHNQLDHCYLGGKFNEGPTIRVYLKGNENIYNYHQINNNYFGPRPRKGGPKAETIQIGDSYTSMAPSYTLVFNNFFDKCNGEVEVISNKSNFNEFRNNVFFECEGSLVLRHGNYCIIDGNSFIGNDVNEFIGGVRVINTGHWITNNYFYNLKGDEFRGPLAIMNGIPKSPLNRYNQVTDVVIAHNTWIDCKSPWKISVGANNDKHGVLPETEIRSARPERTVIANNLVFHHQIGQNLFKAYDKIDGITFKNNIIHNAYQDSFAFEGNFITDLLMDNANELLFVPVQSQDSILLRTYKGFGFEDIKTDIFKQSREAKNYIGAVNIPVSKDQLLIDKKQYGPIWFSTEKEALSPEIISVTPVENISEKLAKAKDGDIVELEGVYEINNSLIINKKISFRSKDSSQKAEIIYSGNSSAPCFEMNPQGSLVLENIILTGDGEQVCFATSEKNMWYTYNLYVKNLEISNFRQILIAHKGSMADTVSFSGTSFKNCQNGIVLAAETDDKGDYNAEVVEINNCNFNAINNIVINFYRGGYDESTIGGCLSIENSRFTNCGSREQSKILIRTHGIVNVNLSNNVFTANPVKYIAVLWGEKNNRHSGNIINQSGEILVEQYLKQKIVY